MPESKKPSDKCPETDRSPDSSALLVERRNTTRPIEALSSDELFRILQCIGSPSTPKNIGNEGLLQPPSSDTLKNFPPLDETEISDETFDSEPPLSTRDKELIVSSVEDRMDTTSQLLERAKQLIKREKEAEKISSETVVTAIAVIDEKKAKPKS